MPREWRPSKRVVADMQDKRDMQDAVGAEGGREEQFIRYTLSTQQESEKLDAFQSHYGAIKREMQRRGTWKEKLRFADIGCGLGLYSEFWDAQGFRVTGVDLNARALAIGQSRARTRHLPIHYVAGSATDVPLESGSFDVVFAMSLLEHVPDWRRCVDELIRLLAPGGLLWIETTNVVCPRQREFRLPLYSWWPRPLKRVAEHLARSSVPALANYTPWPAVHWFSYFTLHRYLADRDLLVSDRFDGMDTHGIGSAKKLVRRVALSSSAGRWAGYLLVSSLIVMGTRPVGGAAIGD